MKPLFKTITSLCILAAPCINLSLALANGAQQTTIYNSSVQWGDVKNRNNLLTTVPQWDNKTIETLFSVYQHPEAYQFPTINNAARYNALFINAFWGPKENPFNKYARPSKAFIFIKENQVNLSYMAPIIQNDADKNYYIFDRDQQRPELLDDWINLIKQAHPEASTIQFAICNGYGSTGDQSCDLTSYQDELRYAIDRDRDSHRSENPLKASISAIRAPNQDWRSIANATSRLNTDKSIYATSVNWDDLNARHNMLDLTATWENYKTIESNFMKLRDLRYYSDKTEVNFSRRISWLYPDDGCWTRASSVLKDLFGPYENINNQFLRPSKVFAFGNLCANTDNHPNGRVTWWYHTAPIIQDAQTKQTYVLDPSINAHEPLKIETWMSLISSTTGACARSNSHVSQFNICNGYGSNPKDVCNDAEHARYNTEASQTLTQIYYQRDERERQIELGRDANKVLGDEAPWLDPKSAS